MSAIIAFPFTTCMSSELPFSIAVFSIPLKRHKNSAFNKRLVIGIVFDLICIYKTVNTHKTQYPKTVVI